MNPEDSLLVELLKQMTYYLPQFVAYLLGIVVAFAKWRRYPRPALLVVLGCGLLMLNDIGQFALVYCIFSQTTNISAWLMTVIRVVHSAVLAGGIMLLVTAAFVARRTAMSSSPLADLPRFPLPEEPKPVDP